MARIPAHEAVAGGGFPGRGAAAEQGQQEAVGGVHEVAQLGTGQGLVAEVVVALDELVPEAAAGVGGAQQAEAQGAGLGQRGGQGPEGRRISPRGRRERAQTRFRRQRRRQGQPAVALHAQQGHARAHLLEAAVGLAPVQRLADRLR